MGNASTTVHVKLTIDGHELEAGVEVPAGRAAVRVLLPVLRQLTDAVVGIAEAGEAGRVSCRKGCDACCRQMVPIGAAEAHGLAAMIGEMPGEAAAVLARFEAAVEVLAKSGVLERLERRHALSAEELAQLDRDYFLLGIACPFLVDHACSIHAERPLACREFLVTSPPEHCLNPTAETVDMVELGAKVSVALAAQGGGWIPLILARRFVAEHREEVPVEVPAQILRGILQAL